MENVESAAKSARMEADLLNIKELLLDIKDELKGLNQTYVPRTEVMEMFRSRDAQIQELKDELSKKKDRLPEWIAVAVAAIALLVSFYSK
jgi:predicted  nucleic acid-binding Zn-ribbon protein